MADKIKVSGSSGADVVTASLAAFSSLFPLDHGFLRRIAWVESKDGTDSGTYRTGYNGGIWQVDKIGFESTQDTSSHPGLKSKFASINSSLGINWKTVSWDDLQKPLYSALAARLFLSNVPAAIPSSVSAQAEYWKAHYNRTGAGTAQKFIDDVAALEEK